MKVTQKMIGFIAILYSLWMFAHGMDHGYKAICLGILFMAGIAIILMKEDLFESK